MMKTVAEWKHNFIEYFILGAIGGCTYTTIEVWYRGYSHWSMTILAAIVFIAIGMLNEGMDWDTPFGLQMLYGGLIATGLEFVAGCILNLWLGWDIWDYSNMPFNILGQVCLPFFFVWCGLAAVIIIADDVIRWKVFGEEKPRYVFWFKG